MKYVADDGTVFNTEKECKDYEERCAMIADCVVLYSEDFREVSMCDAVNDLDDVTYVYVKSNNFGVAEYIGDKLCCDTSEIYIPGVYKINGEGVLFNIDNMIYEHMQIAKELERERDSIYKDQGIPVETEGTPDEQYI